MAYKYLLFEKRDGIGFVTINRPDKLNALNDELIEELFDVFKRIRADDEVGVAILTGAGEKAFVAGADIQEFIGRDPVESRKFSLKGQNLSRLIEGLGKPVIAAINGYALGGGCELAQACTIRIASESARLGQPEVNLGIIPGMGGTQRLPRLIGKGRALELILTGNMIDAHEAHRIGLVNKVVPQRELMKACEEMARVILSKGPVAIRLALDAVNAGMEMSLGEALDYESTLFGLTFSTEDMKEGTKAFMEKRPPKFRGK